MKKVFIIILLLYISGCQKHEVPENYVARVGDSYLTTKDIEEYLNQVKDTSDLQYKLFLKKWIENEVLFLEAEGKDVDKSKKITKQLEDIKKQLTISEYLETEIYSKNVNVNDEEIDNYYSAHKDEFVLSEDAVKINIVTFIDRKAANDFRAEILRSDDWNGTLNKFLSDSIENKLIGSVTSNQLYTQLTLYPAGLWKIANNLQNNEVSFPVKIDNLFYIVQLIAKYPKDSIAPINLVKDEIKNRLIIDKRKKIYQELISSLLKKYQVEIKLNE